jgi:hypothetical protein
VLPDCVRPRGLAGRGGARDHPGPSRQPTSSAPCGWKPAMRLSMPNTGGLYIYKPEARNCPGTRTGVRQPTRDPMPQIPSLRSVST